MQIHRWIDHFIAFILLFFSLVILAIIINLRAVVKALAESSGQSDGAVYAALIALLGVVGTLVLTPIAQRAAEDRKIEHDRNTLRAIIYAELTSIISAYEFERKYLLEFRDPDAFGKKLDASGKEIEHTGGEKDVSFAYTHTYIPVVYFSSFDKISTSMGLLDPEEAGLVMVAYYVYQERTSYIACNAVQQKPEDVRAEEVSNISNANNVSFHLKDNGSFPRENLRRDLGHIIDACKKALQRIEPNVATRAKTNVDNESQSHTKASEETKPDGNSTAAA